MTPGGSLNVLGVEETIFLILKFEEETWTTTLVYRNKKGFSTKNYIQ